MTNRQTMTISSVSINLDKSNKYVHGNRYL